jgi:hypothetical protein
MNGHVPISRFTARCGKQFISTMLADDKSIEALRQFGQKFAASASGFGPLLR